MLKLSKIVIAEGDIGSPVQTATLFWDVYVFIVDIFSLCSVYL